jgi:hypothetical protein
MITTLAATVRVLSEKLAQLENGASCPGDWVRLDVAATRAAVLARYELGGLPEDAIDCGEPGELIDELRYIKLCAESRLFELSGYDARR